MEGSHRGLFGVMCNLLGTLKKHTTTPTHTPSCCSVPWLQKTAVLRRPPGDATTQQHTPCALCGRVKTAWRWSWSLMRRRRVCWRPPPAFLLSAQVSKHRYITKCLLNISCAVLFILSLLNLCWNFFVLVLLKVFHEIFVYSCVAENLLCWNICLFWCCLKFFTKFLVILVLLKICCVEIFVYSGAA
jgi:hypothetical protein